MSDLPYDKGNILRPGYVDAVNNTGQDELILTRVDITEYLRATEVEIDGRLIGDGDDDA